MQKLANSGYLMASGWLLELSQSCLSQYECNSHKDERERERTQCSTYLPSLISPGNSPQQLGLHITRLCFKTDKNQHKSI